ncbi:MAB_1171c family putative transporter [Amycolatopsis anabasis]|uniref:MAB_1171c family putative transporter n=1 Tax=Amycolatopsis anabasis TaxID=1840409 RepID=UPI00131C57CD|nr:MAB_1171c family putative transporter [Amycolatopsis anabasis]
MADPASVVIYLAAAVAVAESVRKAVTNRGLRAELARSYVAAGLGAFGLALAAGAPATMRLSDGLFGVLNIAFLLNGLLAMLAMLCVAGFLRSMSAVKLRLRGAAAVLAVAAAAMVTLYLVDGTTRPEFGSSADHHLTSHAYNLIYLTYMTVWLYLFVRKVRAIARRAERVIRWGLWIAVAGMLVGLAGLAWKLVLTVEDLIAPDAGLRPSAVSLTLAAIGTVLFAAGSAFAALARHLLERRDQMLSRRTHHAIEYLWHAVQPARPPELRDRHEGTPPDLDHQAIRIRDAQLTLRPYIPTGIRELALQDARLRGMKPRDRAMFVEAVELGSALDAFDEGYRYASGDGDVDARPDSSGLAAPAEDDIAWLAQLSRLLQKDLHVERLRQWAREQR